jgi:hypothetical protein
MSFKRICFRNRSSIRCKKLYSRIAQIQSLSPKINTKVLKIEPEWYSSFNKFIELFLIIYGCLSCPPLLSTPHHSHISSPQSPVHPELQPLTYLINSLLWVPDCSYSLAFRCLSHPVTYNSHFPHPLLILALISSNILALHSSRPTLSLTFFQPFTSFNPLTTSFFSVPPPSFS